MPETFEEAEIAQALTDNGGPPELAPQLIAIAEQHQVAKAHLKAWVRFYIGTEWRGQEFAEWCVEYRSYLHAGSTKGNNGIDA
jgi:hypothetical protein